MSEKAPERQEAEVNATEAAALEAGRRGVDLAAVEGTGSGGRVTKDDVEEAARPHYKLDFKEAIVYVDESGAEHKPTDEGYVAPPLGLMQRIRANGSHPA